MKRRDDDNLELALGSLELDGVPFVRCMETEVCFLQALHLRLDVPNTTLKP